jgi:ABC-type transport system substrate-binding protein
MISFVGTTPLAGASMFDPYPWHILGDLYSTGDWESLINHEYWTSEYVAAGPYRFTAWEPGTYQEFSAFEGYIEGKPKIDKIIFRFFGDANTLMANILSGDVDAALPDGISAVAAAELKQTWGAPGTGNTVILYRDGRYSRVEFQHRAEYAMPRAARDPRVRRAFYHTIDKEGLNEVALAGLGKLADSWIAPTDPLRPQFEDVIPKWSYDLSLASRILEDAGWRKGSDGIYVSGATGERLETEIQTSLSARGQAIAILSNGWRQVGADVNENALPSALARDREFRAKLPFAGLVTHFVDLQYEYQQHSCERASSAENRWSGAHYGYCSADANPLIMKLQVTIPEDERTALRHDIMRVMLQEDMALLPMYWYVTVLVRAKGVTGLDELEQRAFRTQPPWNAHLWDRT